MSRVLYPCTLAVLVCAGTVARAGDAPAAGSATPAMRVGLAPESLALRYEHRMGRWLDEPPNPPSITKVGEQTAVAYQAMARRFLPAAAPGAAALTLSVAVRRAATEFGDGWGVVVDHAIEVVGEDGRALDGWTVEVKERITGPGEGGVPNAFARAADEAARRSERNLRTSTAVVAWLRDRGAAPLEVARTEPPEPAAAPEPRRAGAVYAEGLGAIALGDGSGAAAGVRAGVTFRWAFAQAQFSRWSVGFTPAPTRDYDAGAAVEVSLAGLDVGFALRPVRPFELRVGAGPHVALTRASARYFPVGQPGSSRAIYGSASGIGGSAFAAVTGTRPLGRTAMRFGFELRRYVGVDAVIGEFRQNVPAGSTSAGVTLGLELPWGAPGER